MDQINIEWMKMATLIEWYHEWICYESDYYEKRPHQYPTDIPFTRSEIERELCRRRNDDGNLELDA